MPDEKPKKYSKPLPHIDEEIRPWWEALKRHELYIQKCRDCGFTRYYPRALCTNCLSSKTEWVRCSGRGSIYTFTVTNANAATAAYTILCPGIHDPGTLQNIAPNTTFTHIQYASSSGFSASP